MVFILVYFVKPHPTVLRGEGFKKVFPFRGTPIAIGVAGANCF